MTRTKVAVATILPIEAALIFPEPSTGLAIACIMKLRTKLLTIGDACD